MKKTSILGATLGCTLLASSLMACGVDSAPARRRNPPIATMATSAETQAETGASTWQLYHVHKTAPNAQRAFEMVARDPNGKVLHAMKVQMIKEPANGLYSSASHLPHILIDSKGVVRESTLSTTALATQQRFARDASQAKLEEYGCVGDIFWAVGGLIVSIPTCAAIIPGAATGPLDIGIAAACVGTVAGGPVAGTISVVEDCFGSDGSDQNVQYMFEDEDGNYYYDGPPPDDGGGTPDWDY